MLYRVKQFFRGLTAHEVDESLADELLNDRERELFARLPSYEKSHAVNTAATVIATAPPSDSEILAKAALLHDIGKVDTGLGPIKKSVLVLMDRFLHALSVKLSGRVDMFYVYYNHHLIGAKLLEDAGTDIRVIELVLHHQPWDDVYVAGIDYLKKADGMN